MNAIQRFFFNIFLLCFGLGLLFFVKLDSYADGQASLSYRVTSGGNYYLNNNSYSVTLNPDFEDVRLAFYIDGNTFYLLSNVSNLTISSLNDVAGYNSSGNLIYSNSTRVNLTSVRQVLGSYTFYRYDSGGGALDIVAGPNSFSDIDATYDYLFNNILPELPFDDSLELDYFKVSPYGFWDNLVGTPQEVLSFDYKYDIGWSDSRITTVKLRIDSTLATNDFTSSVSPFRGSFKGSTYANQNGDVVRLIATPYKADGSYGVSLYYSFVQDNNSPLVNIWRKLFKNGHTDNTIEIPYNGNDVTLPVDGVGTVNNYKVNYNPVTNEYGDLNLYEIYYQPVVIYEIDTPQEEIDETQDVVSDTYVTNNYYETTKNINLGFDINFGDISTNDITDTFDSFGNFGNGFGSFINRLASWLQLLFPFLHPAVAASIVFVFGLIVSLAIIALVLKIAGVIADIIPF